MRLSAYSTTTMAPSTSIPTARISPNITMLDTATPITASSAKHSRNDVGIAKPTSSAGRMPSAASVTIITSAIAVSTELSSCLTIDSTVRDWSLEVPTVTAARSSSGQSFSASATVSRTRSAVSMMLKPRRLTTCNATVLSPLNGRCPAGPRRSG